jgi:hypothetical protein
MVRNTGKALTVRGKIALMATLLVAYGLGTPWAVSRLPAEVASTLGEFHHEVNQLARGDFKAVMPTFHATPTATEPVVAGWADLAVDRMSRQQPVQPLATGPATPGAGLTSLSFGTLTIGLDDMPRMEASGTWARELAETGRLDPEPKTVAIPLDAGVGAGATGRGDESRFTVSRMAEALAASAPRIAFEPISPAEKVSAAVAAPSGEPKPRIAIETAPSRDARLALFIPDAPDEAALSAQRTAMTGWARSRGYRVVDFFTVADPARPQDDILAAAASGAFSAVAVWNTSETRDAVVIDALRARNIGVVAIPDSVMPPVLSASVPGDQPQTGSTGIRPGRS